MKSHFTFWILFAVLQSFVMSHSSAADQSDIPLSPILSGNWVLQSKEVNAWAEKVLRENYGKNVMPYKVRTKPISFYSANNKKVELMEVAPVGHSGAYYLVLVNGADTRVYLLDGNSKPIHDLNKLVGISIDTPEKAVAYLKFFCSAITSSEGIFLVIDPNAGEVSTSFLQSIDAKPIQIKQEANGDWNITASQLYADTLFDVDFIVHKNGFIDMRNDKPKLKLPLQFMVKVEDGRRIYKDKELATSSIASKSVEANKKVGESDLKSNTRHDANSNALIGVAATVGVLWAISEAFKSPEKEEKSGYSYREDRERKKYECLSKCDHNVYCASEHGVDVACDQQCRFGCQVEYGP